MEHAHAPDLVVDGVGDGAGRDQLLEQRVGVDGGHDLAGPDGVAGQGDGADGPAASVEEHLGHRGAGADLDAGGRGGGGQGGGEGAIAADRAPGAPVVHDGHDRQDDARPRLVERAHRGHGVAAERRLDLLPGEPLLDDRPGRRHQDPQGGPEALAGLGQPLERFEDRARRHPLGVALEVGSGGVPEVAHGDDEAVVAQGVAPGQAADLLDRTEVVTPEADGRPVGREVAVERVGGDPPQPEAGQVEVVDNGAGDVGHDVVHRRRVHLEPRRLGHRLLGGAEPADDVAGLEHHHPLAGPGQEGGADETVVPAADDRHVVTHGLQYRAGSRPLSTDCSFA